MKVRTSYIAVCLSALIILFQGCTTEHNKKVLKVAHILDPGHSVHKAMEYMAERLYEKSGGRMEMKIYPSGQLGSEKEYLELLQIGSLSITKVSAAVMEGFVEEYKVMGMPYLFRDKEHAFAVLNGDVGKKVLLSGDRLWLRGLCFYDAGSRSFYTKNKPIMRPDDLKGMKIRVMNSITAISMVQSLGGSATPITYSELYTALQSGVVDGAENNPPSFYLSRHYEVCGFYSLDEHTTIPDVLLISSFVWNKLSDEEKRWVQEAADESAIYQRKLWMESEQEALAELQKAGITVVHPDKSLFLESVKGLYEDAKTNEKVYSIINDIINFKTDINEN